MQTKIRHLVDGIRLSVTKETLQQVGMTFFSTNLVNVLNWVFNITMARLLGPSEFGILVTLLALYSLAAPAIDTAELVTTRYTATLAGRGELTVVGPLLRGGLSRGVLLGLAAVVVAIVMGQPIANFVATQPMMIFLVSLLFAPMMLMAVINGALRGLTHFRSYSAVITLNGMGRLGLALVGAYFGFGLAGALGGLVGAVYIAVLLGLILLWEFLSSPAQSSSPSLNSVISQTTHTLLGTVATAAILNLPMILVTHFLDATDAGQFASAGTLGKMVLFLPGAAGLVFLPRVTRYLDNKEAMVKSLRKTQLIVAMLATGLAVLLASFSQIAVHFLFGEQYSYVSAILPFYMVASAGYTLCNVWLIFYVALGSSFFARCLAALAVVQVLVIWVWHPGLMEIVGTMALISLCLVALGECYMQIVVIRGYGKLRGHQI